MFPPDGTGACIMAEKKKKKCPMCGKPEILKFRPFCSQRCADLDLGRWLTGEYRFAAEEEVDFDADFAGDE